MSNTPDLKGSSFTLSVLHLCDSEVANTVVFLKEKVAQAPAFFASAPVVINIAKVIGDIDFSILKQGITEAGMIPVGVTGCRDKRRQNLASEAGFAVMAASKSPSQAPAQIAPTKVISTPIRSGQQVYAKDSDLVILNHVSAGAEVIADGSIHIHGSLRGRAIAGASGWTCTSASAWTSASVGGEAGGAGCSAEGGERGGGGVVCGAGGAAVVP